MPGVDAHEQLAILMSEVHELIRRVAASASPEEVTLRADSARQTLDELAITVGAGASGPFGTLGRHLAFLDYWYQRKKPESYASDLLDLTERDLPGVIAAVGSWIRGGLDSGLADAIATSWQAHHYAGAVRDAFIYLENILREIGGVDERRGLSGEKLIEDLLGPNSSSPIVLSENGPFGVLTSGERSGVHHLLRGAFLLARNATAHRPIEYSRHQADDVIHLVNLCLRLVRPGV